MSTTELTSIKAFHSHLDACRQCREHPLALCPTGAHLLKFAAGKSIIRTNAEKDPHYSPYCLRCCTMTRMEIVKPFYWRCKCGAEHDERTPLEVLRDEGFLYCQYCTKYWKGTLGQRCPNPYINNGCDGHLVEIPDA